MKRQEAILQSKRATTELVEIKKALLARLTPATDEPAKEGGEPNPAIAKTFTLEEWKAIAVEAVDVAHRSHPAPPLPVLEPNPSKGERTHTARGKGAGAKRNLTNEVDDDIFQGSGMRKRLGNARKRM